MTERELEIRLGPGASLHGDLVHIPAARGIVVFVHGSGSGRRSRRNRAVAGSLQARGFSTLLFDLLSPAEAAVDDGTAELRFDIGLLATRVVFALDAVHAEQHTAGLPLGLFGASTGAAAALVAAAHRPELVAAVVSRGGRPDLAGEALLDVGAPTLLIVGGRDDVVLDLNRRAAARLGAPCDLQVVPGATHLFEERGALEDVARRAGDWFTTYLHPVTTRPRT